MKSTRRQAGLVTPYALLHGAQSQSRRRTRSDARYPVIPPVCPGENEARKDTEPENDGRNRWLAQRFEDESSLTGMGHRARRELPDSLRLTAGREADCRQGSGEKHPRRDEAVEAVGGVARIENSFEAIVRTSHHIQHRFP
jgi:hypothetical protein